MDRLVGWTHFSHLSFPYIRSLGWGHSSFRGEMGGEPSMCVGSRQRVRGKCKPGWNGCEEAPHESSGDKMAASRKSNCGEFRDIHLCTQEAGTE